MSSSYEYLCWQPLPTMHKLNVYRQHQVRVRLSFIWMYMCMRVNTCMCMRMRMRARTRARKCRCRRIMQPHVRTDMVRRAHDLVLDHVDLTPVSANC